MRPSSRWGTPSSGNKQRTAIYIFIVKIEHDLPPDWISICKYTHIKSKFFSSPVFNCQIPSYTNTSKETYFYIVDYVNGKKTL